MTDAPLNDRPPGTLQSVVALAARFALGGLFLFAAYAKLKNPLLFAQAIEKFHIVTPGEHDHITKLLTFGVPWIEIAAAAALILGFWTRPAALVFVGALLAFTALIINVVARGESFECSCIGRFKLFCPVKLSWCNVYQNGVLLVIALVAWAAGGGRWSADYLFRPRPEPRSPL